jgi:hypothetical protein
MPKKLEDVDQDDDGGLDSQLRPEEAQKQFSLRKFIFGEGGKTIHQRREEIEHTRTVQMLSLFPWPGANRLPCVRCVVVSATNVSASLRSALPVQCCVPK